MKCFSVVSKLRPRVAMLRQRHLAMVVAAGLTAFSLACDESRGPTSPSSRVPSGGSPQPAETRTGLVDGIVRDDSGSVSGALVEVTGTPGGSATTGMNGVFSFI